MPDRTDVTLDQAAKVADLIRREAEYEQRELADKEANAEMGLMSDKPDKNLCKARDMAESPLKQAVADEEAQLQRIDVAMATLEEAQRNAPDKPGKSLRTSRTLWLGIFVGFISQITKVDVVKEYPELVGWFGTIIGVIIFVLRFRTWERLRWRKVKP